MCSPHPNPNPNPNLKPSPNRDHTTNLEVLSEAREDLNHRFARASNHMTLQLVRRLIESSLRGEVKAKRRTLSLTLAL